MRRKCVAVGMKYKGWWLTVVWSIAVGSLFAFNSAAVKGAFEGVLLCGRIVIPSLFPFMFLADFFGRSPVAQTLGKVVSCLFYPLFGLRGSSASAALISFFSGYPVSAKVVSDLVQSGEIDTRSAQRMMRYCVNPGPAFCISAVGAGLLGSAKAGAVIWIAVLLSSVAIGVGFGRPLGELRPKTPRGESVFSVSAAFCDSCSFSASAVFSICAYTVLFSAAAAVLGQISAAKFALPLLEITSGLSRLGRVPLPLLAAFISFGGLSVQLQILWLGKSAYLSFKNIFFWRVVCAALAAVICQLILLVFPVSIPDLPVLSPMAASGRGNIMSSFCLLFSVLVFLGYIDRIFRQKNQII